MKKIIALILSLAMLCALAACSKKPTSSLGARPDPTAPSLNSRPTEPDAEPTEPPIASIAPTEPEEDTVPVSTGDTVHVSKAVFYDYDGIRAYVEDCELPASYDRDDECVIPVTIENNTETDIDFTLSDDTIAINNYVVSAWLFEVVPAGESVSGELKITAEDLYFLDVRAPKSFTAMYLAFDDATYETLSENAGTFTSNASKPGPAVLTSDSILFSESGITVAEIGMYEDYYGDVVYYMQIENNTGNPISADVHDVFANGQEISVYDYYTIYTDCVSICTVTLDGSDLEDVGLDFDAITELDFGISFMDLEEYETITDASFSLSLSYS